MSNYIEYNDSVAFHPGYYIKELIDESGLTQEDFAKRLDTTPKNLSLLIRGEQSLSSEIALKLSRMLGTSIEYWLNLQAKYDSMMMRFKSDKELNVEKAIFKYLEYKYFRDNFGLPDIPRKTEKQIKEVREFLEVASLRVFQNTDMAVSFRSGANGLSNANIVKANIMVQIAINEALKVDAPNFNKTRFDRAVEYALTLTRDHESFYPKIKESFLQSGVILVVLPNMPGSNINGATKKIGRHIMLMVNDRRLYSDIFWFTLFHEIGHIMNGDFGITFENAKSDTEDAADKYAADKLIPYDKYKQFISQGLFSSDDIENFSYAISRDPGIVIGRLLNDGVVKYTDSRLQTLRHKYKVMIKT